MRARLLDPAAAVCLSVTFGACTWIDEAALEARLGEPAEQDTAADGCRAPIAESLPDQTVATMKLEDSSLVDSSSEDIGTASPIGCVDVVSGAIVFGASSGWNVDNDSDAYAFAVPSPARLRMTATWLDTEADLDFGVWSLNEAGTAHVDLFSTNGESNCIGSTDPEACTSAITLTPSEEERPYLLVALGYVGDGEAPYDVELEWLAP
ncbi:MAG: hypothetical protein Q8P18_20750 [Pseudomonadota bacterium]|nr:hypothetical protein [Pseudomonadota bacterium]